MFSMYPGISTSTLDTQYDHWPIHKVEDARNSQHNIHPTLGTQYDMMWPQQKGDATRNRQYKFYPYGATTGYKTEHMQSSACEYRISRDHVQKPLGSKIGQPLAFKKQEKQCHYQHQTPNDVGQSYFPAEYSYPTLNFLLLGNGVNVKHDHKSSRFMYEPYGQQSLPGKQKGTDHLHPFYRRQMMTTAPSRDGLTRTRDQYRVVYTEKQKTLLENEYQTNNFLPESRRVNLAKETELSERQIKFWFQNRRAKDKRKRKTKKASEVKSKSSKASAQDMKSQERKHDEFETITSKINLSHVLSCNNVPPTTCNVIPTPPNHKKQNQGTPQMEHFSSPLTEQRRYNYQGFGNQAISPTTGSCMFENPTGSSVNFSPSPTGCQFQYPISPSDWTSANQNAFFKERVELSPLMHGLQHGLGYRV